MSGFFLPDILDKQRSVSFSKTSVTHLSFVSQEFRHFRTRTLWRIAHLKRLSLKLQTIYTQTEKGMSNDNIYYLLTTLRNQLVLLLSKAEDNAIINTNNQMILLAKKNMAWTARSRQMCRRMIQSIF